MKARSKWHKHVVSVARAEYATDDPEIDPGLNLTFNKAQKRTVNVAISNTFGFGGHNTSVVFRAYS